MAIHKIGVELEGMWRVDPQYLVANVSDACQNLIDVAYDGSIHGRQPLYRFAREVKVGPFVYEAKRWQAALREMWPDYVNATCGLHVHLSFTSKEDYDKIADNYQALWDLLKGNLGKFRAARLKPRMEGKNHFCFPPVGRERQQMSQSRYHAINFLSEEENGTIEFRMLPACSNSQKGIQLIDATAETVKGFLAS